MPQEIEMQRIVDIICQSNQVQLDILNQMLYAQCNKLIVLVPPVVEIPGT